MPDTSTQRQVSRPLMTRRRALQVLIEHAARDVGGVGQGVRPGATEEQKRDVRRAVRVFYKDAFGFTRGDNDLRNLGLPYILD